MTALAVAPTLFDDLSGEPTLDDVLVDVWEGLTSHRIVGCPVCGEEMKPEYAAHALPIGGTCSSCRSTLS